MKITESRCLDETIIVLLFVPPMPMLKQTDNRELKRQGGNG